MLRKPDPPVMIAVTKAESKGKPASVQILDYNVKRHDPQTRRLVAHNDPSFHRFDIEDRKGLEVVILCGLLTFVDYTEGYKEQSGGRPAAPAASPPVEGPSSASAPNRTPPPVHYNVRCFCLVWTLKRGFLTKLFLLVFSSRTQ